MLQPVHNDQGEVVNVELTIVDMGHARFADPNEGLRTGSQGRGSLGWVPEAVRRAQKYDGLKDAEG